MGEIPLQLCTALQILFTITGSTEYVTTTFQYTHNNAHALRTQKLIFDTQFASWLHADTYTTTLAKARSLARTIQNIVSYAIGTINSTYIGAHLVLQLFRSSLD